MLNKNTFKKLIKLLSGVNPDVPLPKGFGEFLTARLFARKMDHKVAVVLEYEGKVPGYAYYVVNGLVLVHGYVDGLPFTESIYREDTIVALNEFMENKASKHSVVATKGTLVWRISGTAMEEIYKEWPDMKAFAMQTAMKYLEMKKDRRNSLLALPEEERMLDFYSTFKGLLPPKHSVIRDVNIATYLALNMERLRYFRKKLKKQGSLNW